MSIRKLKKIYAFKNKKKQELVLTIHKLLLGGLKVDIITVLKGNQAVLFSVSWLR